MRHWKITDRIDPQADASFATTQDDQTPADAGYDPKLFEWTEQPAEPTEADTLKAAIDDNPFAAHEWARAEVDRKVEAAISEAVPEPALAAFIMDAHSEVQIFKLMLDIKNKAGLDLVPTDETELQKRFPNVMAVAFKAQLPPFDVALILEERYWLRVKAIALARASQIIANDQIGNAVTAEDMIDVAYDADMKTEGDR